LKALSCRINDGIDLITLNRPNHTTEIDPTIAYDIDTSGRVLL
jgi:hypothetical protein